jgi:SH3-like domain-containing protein
MKVPAIYILTYARTDVAGNTGSVIRAITVVDTTAPILSIIGSGSLTIAHGSTWSDPGVSYTDIVIGTGTIVVPFAGSVNTAVVGTYTLQYKKSDTAGNTSSIITRTVYVTDQTAPTIVLNNSATTVYIGAVFTDLGATWTDAVDGTGVVLAYSGVVNTNVLGSYTLAYRKIDAAGNISSIITHTVSVVNPPAPGGSGGGGGGGSSYIPPVAPTPTTVTNTGSTASGITSTGTIAIGSTTPVRQIPVRKSIIRTPVSKTPITTPLVPVQVSPAPAIVPPVHISTSMILNTAKTAIFTTPSARAKFLGYLIRGNSVTILAEKDGWIQFTINGITGWSKSSVFVPGANTVSISQNPVNPPVEVNNLKNRYYATAPRVNIRVSANATSQSTRHLTGGENVTLLSNLGSWAQIQTSDGYTGWVAARYIAPR